MGHEPDRDESPLEPAAACRAKLVTCWQAGVARGATCTDAAGKLGVCPRTLRHWRRRTTLGTPPARPVGRPRCTLDQARRQEIIASIKQLGTRTGVATFQARFPTVPRRELAKLKNRYRRVVTRWRRRRLARLEWTQPGAVWAMDHAEPPLTIDGKYEYILSVRDLACGYQLVWLPIERADADTTVAVLEGLFAAHGPPLVIKNDNGKALMQGSVPGLLARHAVTPLVSPPYRPQYNGSCEAGVRAMKVRTEDLAFLEDRSRHWTAQDLDHALRIANEHHRPDRAASPSRAQRWRDRTAISPEQRAAFQAAVETERQTLAAQLPDKPPAPSTGIQQHTLERKLQRQSVAHTLVESGLLIIHRRPNTPDIKTEITARNT